MLKMSKNMNDKYIDPPTTPYILSKIMSLPTVGDIKKLADEIFPDWFVTTMNVYCQDYPHLMSNWKKICKMTNVKPAQIMIVEECVFDASHSLVRAFSECFTSVGFSVRRKLEYVPCDHCGCAVPTEIMWKLFKDKGIQVPDNWSQWCVGCKYSMLR